ncbi:hypothetical protein NQZ68_025553 [Dissostichus eleginoides]|nr:hypothetical protein NQZ68_025553 [Dissostichus eleginoides]
MELQEIPNEGETHEEGEGASEPMLEVKTEEEAEPDHYSKLQSPSEDIYSEALFSGDPVKTRTETTRAEYKMSPGSTVNLSHKERYSPSFGN